VHVCLGFSVDTDVSVGLCVQAPAVKVFESLSVEVQLYSCAGLVLLSFIFLLLARFSFRYKKKSRL